MKRSKLFLGASLILATYLMTDAGTSSAQNVVRAWGMGGAGTAASRGLDAVAFNPANLAFSSGTAIGLPSIAANIHNNSLSLNRYNEITGQYLDSASKAQLLNEVPASGFGVDADIRAAAIGVQRGRFALSLSGLGAGRGNLDKDYFNLLLNGNQYGQTLDFSNTWGQGSAVAAATASVGHIIRRSESSQLSVGLNARYLKGLYESHVSDAYGTLATGLNAIDGEVYVATESATGGRGYGLDLGLAWQTASGWQVGLAVDNVVGSVRWDRGTTHREMRLTAAGISLTNGDLSKAVANADTSFASSGYTTSLPLMTRLGVARQLGSFVVAADYAQGFTSRRATSSAPQINAGVEWHPLSFLQPRLGLASGGENGQSVSVGLGLKLGPWRIDAAAVSRDGLSAGDNKGLAVALGSELVF